MLPITIFLKVSGVSGVQLELFMAHNIKSFNSLSPPHVSALNASKYVMKASHITLA